MAKYSSGTPRQPRWYDGDSTLLIGATSGIFVNRFVSKKFGNLVGFGASLLIGGAMYYGPKVSDHKAVQRKLAGALIVGAFLNSAWNVSRDGLSKVQLLNS